MQMGISDFHLIAEAVDLGVDEVERHRLRPGVDLVVRSLAWRPEFPTVNSLSSVSMCTARRCNGRIHVCAVRAVRSRALPVEERGREWHVAQAAKRRLERERSKRPDPGGAGGIPVSIQRTAVGEGVFAPPPYRADDTIGEILGDVIESTEYGSDYCFRIGDELCLEPSPPFRYVNHCCDPNCEFDWFDVSDTGRVPAPQENGVFLGALWGHSARRGTDHRLQLVRGGRHSLSLPFLQLPRLDRRSRPS